MCKCGQSAITSAATPGTGVGVASMFWSWLDNEMFSYRSQRLVPGHGLLGAVYVGPRLSVSLQLMGCTLHPSRGVWLCAPVLVLST